MAKTNSGLLEFKDAQKVLIALDDATSEVKKAVVIDADGVETDIQGVQPTGKKEITSTEEVNVANYATAQVVDADLVAGNIKKDVDILGVVGSYEAAASDFSTAEVVVTDNGAEQTIAGAINISDDYLMTDYVTTGSSTPDTVTAVLYKGSASWMIGTGTVSVTGNATAETSPFGTQVTITGDCTITISVGQ